MEAEQVPKSNGRLHLDRPKKIDWEKETGYHRCQGDLEREQESKPWNGK